MKKISVGSWAFTIGPYASRPVDFEQVAQRVKDCGYDAIEIAGTGAHVTLERYPTPESRAELKQMLDGLGLEISGYLADLAGIDPSESGQGEAYVEQLERNLELCTALGIGAIRVDSGAPANKYKSAEEADEARKRLAETFRAAAEKAQAAEIVLNWEFEPHLLANKASEIAALPAAVGHANFKVMYDTAHAYITTKVAANQLGGKELVEGGPAALLESLSGHVGAVHVIDSDGTLCPIKTSTHAPFGTGYVDFAGLGPALLAASDTPYWTVDMAFWAGAWEMLEPSRIYVKRWLDGMAAQAA